MLTQVENAGSGPLDTSQSPFAPWKTKGFRDVPLGEPVQGTVHPARLIVTFYYAWDNREIGGMRVWIPEKLP
jgi:hypothetical protein